MWVSFTIYFSRFVFGILFYFICSKTNRKYIYINVYGLITKTPYGFKTLILPPRFHFYHVTVVFIKTEIVFSLKFRLKLNRTLHQHLSYYVMCSTIKKIFFFQKLKIKNFGGCWPPP
jgi:hypothetical protein